MRYLGIAIGIVVVASVISIGHIQSARAVGCISGGVAGAAVGHLAHHGIVGAIGGCIAGHEYNKHQKEQSEQRQSDYHQNHY